MSLVVAAGDSSAGIWAPVIGVVCAAFITTAGGVLASRAQKAAKSSEASAAQVTEDAGRISAERELIETLGETLSDLRTRLVTIEVREERCQERLNLLENRDAEQAEALRDASILQKALQHEVEDLQEQIVILNGIIERRKLNREV